MRLLNGLVFIEVVLTQTAISAFRAMLINYVYFLYLFKSNTIQRVSPTINSQRQPNLKKSEYTHPSPLCIISARPSSHLNHPFLCPFNVPAMVPLCQVELMPIGLLMVCDVSVDGRILEFSPLIYIQRRPHISKILHHS